jgi:CRP/FNR family cyclic AMP-dependent transcriptional regulator
MEQEIREKLYFFFTKFEKQIYKKNTIVILADENPSDIFYIQEGIVRQYYISKDGKEITLNTFKSHSLFPMSWTASNIHNHYFFEAMTDITIFKAPKEELFHFLKKEPYVLLNLIKRIYIGIEGLWMRIIYSSSGSTYAKLVCTLLILAKRFGKNTSSGIIINLKLTEKTLGTYAGAYRETVSRVLQVLKSKGLVSYEKGFVTIPNMQKLEDELTL